MNPLFEFILIVILMYLSGRIGYSTGKQTGVRDYKDKVIEVLKDMFGNDTRLINQFFKQINQKFNEDRHKI